MGFEETSQPSRAGFYSLPIQEVLEGLPMPLGIGCSVYTCECNRATFGGPVLPLLVHKCGCAALLLLPCSYGV